MEQVKTILQKLGFSEIESAIYLAALSLAEPGASDIAKKIGKNRTAAYFHIKNLVGKGLLKETRRGKKLRFIPLPPSDLAASMSSVAADLKRIVPRLESLEKIERLTPVVEITESKDGFYKIYEEVSAQEPGSLFRVLEGKKAITAEFLLFSEAELSAFFRQNADRHIVAKAIFTKESLSVPRKMLSKSNFANLTARGWNLRTLPETILPFQELLFIYGNKIAFLFPDTNLVVTITHRTIAESLAALFDGLHAFARPAEWG
ncbi:MAG: helix-turn-helix domain-containing protein [Candidatus Uhrbacteria bacterium]|nr:helix-turn-helix domain-containing protein [Candidatus Uhrbacteria bacterium]